MSSVTKAFGLTLAVLATGALTAASASAHPVQRDITCPKNYFPADVRIYGQRLEGDPQKDGTYRQIVIQNNWEDTDDKRYVVARACVRPLTGEENNELFQWGSR